MLRWSCGSSGGTVVHCHPIPGPDDPLLSLADNNIGVEGAKAIAHALEVNPGGALTKLWLESKCWALGTSE